MLHWFFSKVGKKKSTFDLLNIYLTFVIVDLNVGSIRAENFAYALKIAISLFVNGIICM